MALMSPPRDDMQALTVQLNKYQERGKQTYYGNKFGEACNVETAQEGNRELRRNLH